MQSPSQTFSLREFQEKRECILSLFFILMKLETKLLLPSTIALESDCSRVMRRELEKEVEPGPFNEEFDLDKGGKGAAGKLLAKKREK